MKTAKQIKKFLKRLKPETYIAILTFIISLFAIYVSKSESKKSAMFNRESILIAKEMNEQTFLNHRLSVQPILGFSTNLVPETEVFDFIGVEVDNRGIGPAIILPPLLIYKGKPLGVISPSNAQNIINSLRLPIGIFINIIHTSHVIEPGEKRKIIWMDKEASPELQFYMKELVKNIEIIFYYSSIYREQYTVLPLKEIENEELYKNYFKTWFPKEKLNARPESH